MIIEIRFNFQTCVQSAVKFISNKFVVRGLIGYQMVTSKGSRTMGSEWPDKRDKTGLGSVTRVCFFRMIILPILTVWARVVWVTGLFSLCKISVYSYGAPHTKMQNAAYS